MFVMACAPERATKALIDLDGLSFLYNAEVSKNVCYEFSYTTPRARCIAWVYINVVPVYP